MVRYRVYLWLIRSSQAADAIAEVIASSPLEAVQAVMRFYALSFTYYAWVVPENDALPCIECYQVHCALPLTQRR